MKLKPIDVALKLPLGMYESPSKLCSAIDLGASGCETKTLLSPGILTTRHRHPSYEVLFVYWGAVVLSIDDKCEVLTPGDGAIFRGDAVHGMRPISGRYLRTIIHFSPDLIDTETTPLIFDHNDTYRLFSLPLHVLEQVIAEKDVLEKLSRIGCRDMTHDALSRVLGLIDKEPNRPAGYHLPEILRNIVEFMVKYPEAEIDLEELSRMYFLSERYLHKLFRRYLRTTPRQFWLHLKIEQACNWLLMDASISNLAPATGFSTRRGFERAFRRITGITPSMYRQNLANL